MEVTYMASLLKKKAPSVNNPDIIKEIQQKAITTLIVLTTNLIQGDTPLESILNFYREPTRELVTRLLIRCKKMYEARVDAKKILHSILLLNVLLTQFNNDSLGHDK